MEITMTFTDSRNRQQTAKFVVYRAAALTPEQRSDLYGQGYQIIGRGEWRDDEDYEIEKRAAQQCGILRGEAFLVKSEF